MRQVFRWGVRHGLIRWSSARGARAGEVSAALMVDPAYALDPFPHYEAIRAKGPLYDNGFALSTVSHAVTTAVLRSPDFGVIGGFSGNVPRWLLIAQAIGGSGPLGPVEPPSMLAVDQPDHTRYRKLVSRAFTARAVAALRSRTEEIADELLTGLERRRDVDLMTEYASLLPATVIAEMLGAPVAMSRRFLAWGAEAARSLDAGLSLSEFRRSERGLRALQRWMEGHFAHLRAHPGDDILSTLVHAQSAEGKLTQDELTATAMLLLAAGFETTVNLIGNGTALLIAHPEQHDRLRAEPALWPNAVDEVLRLDSPVQRTGRVAQRDTVLAGVRVPVGKPVMTLLGGANRDPEVFDEPGRFDVGRPNAGEHLAFSSGIHYCLGAGLARMEGTVGLQALFGRFPDIALAGTPHRRATRVLRGYESVPVRLSAPARQAKAS
jgi:cytochrome P450